MKNKQNHSLSVIITVYIGKYLHLNVFNRFRQICYENKRIYYVHCKPYSNKTFATIQHSCTIRCVIPRLGAVTRI